MFKDFSTTVEMTILLREIFALNLNALVCVPTDHNITFSPTPSKGGKEGELAVISAYRAEDNFL